MVSTLRTALVPVAQVRAMALLAEVALLPKPGKSRSEVLPEVCDEVDHVGLLAESQWQSEHGPPKAAALP